MGPTHLNIVIKYPTGGSLKGKGLSVAYSPRGIQTVLGGERLKNHGDLSKKWPEAKSEEKERPHK